jgi:hypothetical protein
LSIAKSNLVCSGREKSARRSAHVSRPNNRDIHVFLPGGRIESICEN